ncbi:MAG: hypothetical protein V4543_09625 [Bacteroidota bacterium]
MWETGSFRTRQKLQQIVFPQGIAYERENGNYRTFEVNPGQSVFLWGILD